MPRVWALARWLSFPLHTLMCVCVGALAIQRRVLSKEEETTVRARILQPLTRWLSWGS